MAQNRVQEMSEAELDAHIDTLKRRLQQEQKRHAELLKLLQTIKDRRKQFTAQTDRNEIERIQKLIETL